MGVREMYEEEKKKKKENEGALFGSVKNLYLSKNAETVGKEISNRVNTWLTNNKNYISNAQNRFSANNTSFRTDASDWLTTVTTQRENFQKEAESIKSVLTQYKDFFGEDYVNSVFKALDGNLKAQESVLDASTKDVEYWSQWASEDEYYTAKRHYDYQKKYEGMSYDQILSSLDALDDAEEKEWLNAHKYSLLSSASDFADNSQYVSTYRGGEKFNYLSGTYSDTGFDDIMYDYINRDETARQRKQNTDIAYNTALLGLDKSERREMEDDEIKIFNYLYATQGSEAAYEYIDLITSDLNIRQREAREEQYAKYAEEDPVGTSVFSVVTSPLKGLSYIGQIADYAEDGSIDQNAGYNKFVHINSAIRDEVSTTVEENWGGVGSFAYQTGMSMADFLFTTAVSGGNDVLSLAIMGTGAAADTVVSAKDRGLNDNQAFALGTVAGAAEIAMEKIGLDALFDTAKLGKNALAYVLKNTLAEGGEEVGTELINTLADIIIAQDKSQFITEYNYYMSQGQSAAEAFGHALGDKLILAGLGGAISGGILGGGGAVINAVGNTMQGADMKKTYGADIGGALATEATEIDPNSKFAQRMQNKVDGGKSLSNRQIGKLVQQNEAAMYENDVATIQSAAESRLTELGETGNVKAIAAALAKQVQGERLTFTEREAIKSSKFGQRVANELNTDNIKSGEYSSSWAEKIGTDRINAEEYGKLLQSLDAPDTNVGHKATVAAEAKPAAENAQNVTENATAKESPAEAKFEASDEVVDTDESTVTLEDASKKYGAQAGAMISTYTKGQDVAKYDAAYSAAYNMGKSGVALSYAMNSGATAYLTENQRKLAHAAGADASSTTAKAQAEANKAKANGKTGRRKGTVRGEGVKIEDLRKAFNDTQGKAYKLLTTYAEATGIDIVLYNSAANADGKFEGAQGKFKWSEDTIYIDINAGIADVGSVDDLAKYTMLRTFSHEFSHFIEKWNPVWYNEFRKVVFDTLTERGENVEALIETKQAQNEGMTYDKASREVVAEAMTDILPDANFVEDLANNHKTIFAKLLEKLKEFVADLKAYFSSIDPNSSREANALKEQIGEGVKYVENIVKLFDKVAVEAVTNYQATVATNIETNTDGGINHAEQEVVDARGDRSDAEGKPSGTRKADESRSRVSEAVGEKGESIQEAESVPRSDRGLSNNKWLLDSNNYIAPAPGSELHKAQSMLTDEYGIECHIVKASEWRIAESPAVTTPDGAVLISEGVDSDDLNALPTHEATHAMKSKGFKPYLEFIERTPDMLNMSSKEAMRLMQMILEHVGYTLDDITIDDADNDKDRAKKRKRLMRLYDETNAFAYGISVSGQISDSKFDLDWIFDVFANHMASMAQYNAMALPVLDAIRWFNYQQKTEDHLGNRYVKNSVREQMTRVYGVTEETRPGAGKRGYAEDFVLGILKAFNGTEAQGIPADTTFMNTLRRYNMAQVAFNARVIVQQPLAISRAALLIDYGSIVRGMKLKPAAIKQNIAEMQQYSGIAAWKSLGFYDVNISRGLTDTIKHSTTVGQKIGEIGMWGAEQADTLTWAAMWSACKEEVIKKEKITPRDADFYDSVTELFEEVIYKTQVVDSILTKNEFLRSKGLGARIAGSFMSEPTTTASMLIDAVDKYNADLKRGMSKQQAWAKNKHMIGRTLYVYAVSAVMLAAVQAIADAWRDDDDYETVIEKWLEAFGGNVIDELMPVNKLPILSDFYDLGKELLSIIGVDTYGNPPTSVYMQWYDSLVKGTQIIYQKIANEDTNYTWYGGIYKLLQAASGIAGLPMAAATREVIAIWNNTVGAMAPSLKLKSYDPGDMSEIKYAYADGYLTFDEAAAELLEKGLVENEDEAYFTISGWEAGDGYSRYDKVYEAVRTGASIDEAVDELVAHGYTEKEVISQLKSQIGRWYYDDKSDYRISKQQAIDMLTKYTDMTDEEITKKVNEWSCKVVTGIAYGDIGDEYMAGNITASRAIEMYMRYGGMTKEDATNKVSVYTFIKDHPSLDGESVSYAFVTAYNEYCEPQGVDVDVFHDVWQYMGSAESDKDKHGKVIPDSKKQKVLAYVDSLDLSRRQKDALYYALGYAKSTIKDAPWH